MNDVHISPRAGRRKERLDGILETAAAIVASEGLEALTLHRLARKLGYVPAALYRYFSSKDALVAELQRRTIDALHGDFRATLESARTRADAVGLEPTATALLPILSAAALYLELPKRAREHFGLISVMLADPRQLVPVEEAEKTAPALMAFLGDVRDSMAGAADAGALAKGDAFDRTLILWSTLQGIAQLGKISRFAPDRFDVQRLGMGAARSLLVGWGASTSALEHAEAALSAPAPAAATRQSSRTTKKAVRRVATKTPPRRN